MRAHTHTHTHTHFNSHFDPFVNKHEVFGLMNSVFANGPGDRGSIPGRVIPKTQKMALDASLVNTQHYKVWMKGKVGQSREWSSALPNTLRCSSYWNGAFGSLLTKIASLALYIFINKYCCPSFRQYHISLNLAANCAPLKTYGHFSYLTHWWWGKRWINAFSSYVKVKGNCFSWYLNLVRRFHFSGQ